MWQGIGDGTNFDSRISFAFLLSYSTPIYARHEPNEGVGGVLICLLFVWKEREMEGQRGGGMLVRMIGDDIYEVTRLR